MTRTQERLMKLVCDYMYNNSLKWKGKDKILGVSPRTLHKVSKGLPISNPSLVLIANGLGAKYCEETLLKSNVFKLK